MYYQLHPLNCLARLRTWSLPKIGQICFTPSLVYSASQKRLYFNMMHSKLIKGEGSIKSRGHYKALYNITRNEGDIKKEMKFDHGGQHWKYRSFFSSRPLAQPSALSLPSELLEIASKCDLTHCEVVLRYMTNSGKKSIILQQHTEFKTLIYPKQAKKLLFTGLLHPYDNLADWCSLIFMISIPAQRIMYR